MPEFTITAVLLRQQLGAPTLELGDLGAEVEAPGGLEHADDRVDLALVVDRAGLGDGGMAGVRSCRRAYRATRWSSNPSLRYSGNSNRPTGVASCPG